MKFLRSLSLSAVALSLLVGCKDATAPSKPFAVTVTSKPIRPPDFRVEGDDAVIACAVEFEAWGSGHGGAFWRDAKFVFYAGKERAVPFDSGTVSPADVADAWDTERIESDERWPSYWEFAATVPFTVRATFSFLVDGESEPRSTSIAVNCGPTIDPGAPAPAITELSVTPATAIEPRQTLRVHYSVESTVGLWKTVVVVSGACETVVEHNEWLAMSASRTVDIPISATCQLGSLLEVSVYAVDAALQESRSQGPMLTVADLTPPVLSVMATPLAGPLAPIGANGVDLFIGETFDLALHVYDNIEAGMVAWELPGLNVSDSVSVAAGLENRTVHIPLPPGSEGAYQLRVTARDKAGHQAIPYISASDAIRVHPTVDRVRAMLSLTSQVADFVIDTRRSLIYLREVNASRISVLSMASQAIIETIPLAAPAEGMDLTISGDSLVVSLSGLAALYVINLNDRAAAPTVIPLSLDTDHRERPIELRVLAGGKVMTALSGQNLPARKILEVDLATGVHQYRTPGEPGTLPYLMVERSHDRTKLVISGQYGVFQRYDRTTDTFGPRRIIELWGWRPSVNGNGSVTAVGFNLYGAALESLGTVLNPSQYVVTPASAMSANSEDMFVDRPGRGIIRVRISDGRVLDRTVSFFPADLMRVSDDGSVLAYAGRVGSGYAIAWMQLH